MVCLSLFQWTTFCLTSPPWPIPLGWPHMAWLSFIELDKAVVHVIRLTSFLWLWFQCVCPLMPSHNTYRLTLVSLILDMGYLFMAAPAKCSHCSLPWTWDISSWPLLLTLDVGYLLSAARRSSTTQPLLTAVTSKKSRYLGVSLAECTENLCTKHMMQQWGKKPVKSWKNGAYTMFVDQRTQHSKYVKYFQSDL